MGTSNLVETREVEQYLKCLHNCLYNHNDIDMKKIDEFGKVNVNDHANFEKLRSTETDLVLRHSRM